MKRKYIYMLIVLGVSVSIIAGTYAGLQAMAKANINGSIETIKVLLTGGENVIASNLIPASESVVDNAYSKSGVNKCIDEDGLQVCSVYTFSVANNTTSGFISINAKMFSTKNEFTNLKYKVFKTSGSVSGIITSSASSAPITGNSGELFTGMIFPAKSQATYDVVIWLNETQTNQISEMDKTYTGYVNITNDDNIETIYD